MGQKTRVLIVDDEPDLLEVLALELELSQFQVVRAINGQEALNVLKQQLIDVVLSDIRMPIVDGIKLLEDIMKTTPFKPPVLFMSGYSDCDEEKAFAKGAVGYYHKPVDSQILIQALRESVIPLEERWAQKKPPALDAIKVAGQWSSLEEAKGAFALGAGGFFYTTNSPKMRSGLPVTFLLECERNARLEGEGLIRWVRREEKEGFPQGIGVEFKFLTASSIKAFQALQKKQRSDVYIPQK